VGFEVDVENIGKAAAKLGNGKPPSLSAEGSPNVGGTDRAAGYAGDYEVWFLTRKEDLEAAKQQVESLVENIKLAAKSYHGTDDEAGTVFLNALDKSFAGIDR
jgi:hypothetical protein